jgi:hypothetical protein
MLPMTRAFILHYGLKGCGGRGQPASDAVVLDHRPVVGGLRGLGHRQLRVNDGVAQALLSAQGFDASIIASLANRGLATLTTEKVLANERLTVVAMVRITEAGRRALAA